MRVAREHVGREEGELPVEFTVIAGVVQPATFGQVLADLVFEMDFGVQVFAVLDLYESVCCRFSSLSVRPDASFHSVQPLALRLIRTMAAGLGDRSANNCLLRPFPRRAADGG